MSLQPDRPVLISNSDQLNTKPSYGKHALHLFPENYFFPAMKNSLFDHAFFIKSNIRRQGWDTLQEAVSEMQQASDVKEKVKKPNLARIRCWYPSILICGHGGRDSRCGVLGPLLRQEFDRCIQNKSEDWLAYSRASPQNVERAQKIYIEKHRYIASFMKEDWLLNEGNRLSLAPRTALISHVGGHAWAGNVIIYFPPNYELADGDHHPLAGQGVWYGRVEPKHVEGILSNTVEKGIVIEELLRGIR